MTIKEQLTIDQWKTLVNAPGAASTFVSTASGGAFEVFSEVFTASKFSAELARKEGGSGYGMLVDEILDDMKDMTVEEAKEYAVKYQSRDPQGIRDEIKQYIANTVALARTLPDYEGYKRFILEMIVKVAETKTGGILGIGGSSVVDDKERSALEEIAAILG